MLILASKRCVPVEVDGALLVIALNETRRLVNLSIGDESVNQKQRRAPSNLVGICLADQVDVRRPGLSVGAGGAAVCVLDEEVSGRWIVLWSRGTAKVAAEGCRVLHFHLVKLK